MLICAPVALFYGILWRQWTVIPLADDYTALLDFALRWHRNPGLLARAVALISVQDTEYKLIFDHAVVAASLVLTGRVHFAACIVIGNLMLLPVLWVWWRNTEVTEPELWRRLLLFAPIAFLLFQLNYAETVNWAMAGLQNLTVIAASLLSIDLLGRRVRYAFPGACVAALVACCASANGFLLFPIGLWQLVRRRSAGLALLWSATFAIVATAYLYRLQWIEKSHAGLLANCKFLLNILGGAFENMHREPVHGAAAFLGLVMVVVLTAFMVARGHEIAPFALNVALWILMTCALIAFGRASFGEEFALASRYKIYSDLMLIVLYSLGLAWLRSRPVPVRCKRLLFGLSLGLSIAMCLASDTIGDGFLRTRREDLQAALQEFKSSGGAASPMHDPQLPRHTGMSFNEARVRGILVQSLQAGTYKLP